VVAMPLETDWQRRNLRLDVHHPKVQLMANTVQEFCRSWFRREGFKRLLILMGDSGCGKTHTAKRVANWARGNSSAAWTSGAWEHPPSVMSVLWPRVCSGFAEWAFGVVDDLCEADLVVLDDVGAEYEKMTDLARDKLCQVLSRREACFTVVTTNVALERWSDVFGMRVADRLMRRSHLVDLLGVPTYAMAAGRMAN
jgi:hypothetical protein